MQTEWVNTGSVGAWMDVCILMEYDGYIGIRVNYKKEKKNDEKTASDYNYILISSIFTLSFGTCFS